MSEILIESLGASRYAPVNINAYQYNGLKGLTFGQLIMAVCCRRAAAIEAQSVIKMNTMNASNQQLTDLSAAAERIFTANGPVSQTDEKLFKNLCGLTDDDLKDIKDLGSYDKRTALFGKVKPKLDSLTTLSQEQAVELQSLISRRDVTYNTSASTVKTLMQSALGMAAAIG